MKSIAFLLSFWGIALHTKAQDFHFKYYTTKDGLSNNEVTVLQPDGNGFVWIGTNNGLNRFDGNSFETFRHISGDSLSLAGNQIQALYIDRNKKMWIGTNEGISLFQPSLKQFSNFAPDTAILPLIGTSFRALAEDSEGNLWVGTINDLLIFDPASHHFSSSGWAGFASKTAPPGGNHLRVIVLNLLTKSDHELWVLTTYGLYSVDTKTKLFRFHPYPGGENFDYFGCQLKYADAKGLVWISLYGAGILCFDADSNRWHDYHMQKEAPSYDNASSVRNYSGDTLIYGSLDNAVFFNSGERKIISIHPLFPGSEKPKNPILCNDLLRIGNVLWLASTSGLVKMIPNQHQINFHSIKTTEKVYKVYQTKKSNALIYGTEFSTFINYPGKATIELKTSAGEKILGWNLYLIETSGGDCWFNSETAFYFLRKGESKATRIPFVKKVNESDPEAVRNMVIDTTGKIWLRTKDKGIYSLEAGKDSLRLENGLPNGASKAINALYYDSLSHCLWIAEEFNGVYVYDIGKKTVQHYLLNNVPSQRGATVISISGDKDGNIWLNNLQNGIIKYDRHQQTFLRLTSNEGLLSDNTYWLTIDKNQHLWISTDQGLSLYDIEKGKFTNYPALNGNPPGTANYLSQNPAGDLLLPYENGYFQWSPEAMGKSTQKGQLYVKATMALNSQLPPSDHYEFSPEQNSIQFRIGWLDLENPLPPNIEYQLNEGTWIRAQLPSMIFLTGLPSGKYTLTIRTVDLPSKNLVIRFQIDRPFWLKNSFLIAMAMLAIAILIYLYRRRISAIRKEAALKEQVLESEMTALRSQMNPHFIFNTLNSINSYIIEKKPHEASEYLTEFSQLVRIILEHSQKKYILLEEEVKALKLYLELESKRLDYSFDYRIDWEDPRMLQSRIPPLIVQPFVENAIWHGLRNKKEPGLITITILSAPTGIRIIVADDGIGRKASASLNGARSFSAFGIKATLQRIHLANPDSDVKIDDLYTPTGQPCGTRVEITLHLKE